jgi:hypothetical protein
MDSSRKMGRKQPVEKPVEIVEKFSFSTGVPRFSNICVPVYHTKIGVYTLP